MAAGTVEDITYKISGIEARLNVVEYFSTRAYRLTQQKLDEDRAKWPISFVDRIRWLMEHHAELTDLQQKLLIIQIRRARELKESILKLGYSYPEELDQDFDWIKQQVFDTEEVKTFVQNEERLDDIAGEFSDFKQVCRPDFEATPNDLYDYQEDWDSRLVSSFEDLIEEQATLTDEQRSRLADFIRHARSLKESILKFDFEYPQVIDLEFEWMPEHEHDTPQEKAILKNDYWIFIATEKLEGIEIISLMDPRISQPNWKGGVFAFWKSHFCDPMKSLLENAAVLTAGQKEKIVDIIQRIRVLKEQILAHNYPFPQEFDSQSYDWMPRPLSETPEEMVIRQNDLSLFAVTRKLNLIEYRCSDKFKSGSTVWVYSRSDWIEQFCNRIPPLLENADMLTPKQKEKLVDIIRRTRAIKEQLLAHDYPYPQEIDRDYAWMKG
jgi:hypothetical protein